MPGFMSGFWDIYCESQGDILPWSQGQGKEKDKLPYYIVNANVKNKINRCITLADMPKGRCLEDVASKPLMPETSYYYFFNMLLTHGPRAHGPWAHELEACRVSSIKGFEATSRGNVLEATSSRQRPRVLAATSSRQRPTVPISNQKIKKSLICI